MNEKLKQEYRDQTGKYVFNMDINNVVHYTRKYVAWLEKRVKKQKKSKRKSYLKGYADGLELGCALSHSKELRDTRPLKDL